MPVRETPAVRSLTTVTSSSASHPGASDAPTLFTPALTLVFPNTLTGSNKPLIKTHNR